MAIRVGTPVVWSAMATAVAIRVATLLCILRAVFMLSRVLFFLSVVFVVDRPFGMWWTGCRSMRSCSFIGMECRGFMQSSVAVQSSTLSRSVVFFFFIDMQPIHSLSPWHAADASSGLCRLCSHQPASVLLYLLRAIRIASSSSSS